MSWRSASRRALPARPPAGALLAAEALLLLVALAWIGYLMARPVLVPVRELSTDVLPLRAESLTGVKEQTFVVPTERLSRVDVWVDTVVAPGSWLRVKFELARGVTNRIELASAVVVFDRSRRGWPVQLSFDPELTEPGDPLYLRMESVVNTPLDHVWYWFSARDVFADGEFLDLDQVAVPGQDLVLAMYRASDLPKPLAWFDALIARVVQAGERSGAPPT